MYMHVYPLPNESRHADHGTGCNIPILAIFISCVLQLNSSLYFDFFIPTEEMARGRPRKRLSRMDAAVDAMSQFGFEKELVARHVKELLREYGGDGWPFIEDCSYKELLDSILREQETDNLENAAGDEDQIEGKSGGDEELARPSEIASDTAQEPQGNAPLDPIDSTTPVNNNADGNGWKDIHPNKMVENHVTKNDQESSTRQHSQTEIPAMLPPTPTTRRCLHFYGWIDRYGEAEDDNDFITLRPSSMVLGPPKAAMPQKLSQYSNGETRRKRRSRWDVRPDDP